MKITDKMKREVVTVTYTTYENECNAKGKGSVNFDYVDWFDKFKHLMAKFSTSDIEATWEMVKDFYKSKKNYTATDLKADYFPMRKRVVKFVREAKAHIESVNPKLKLPWVKLRIVKFGFDRVAGVADFDKKHINLSENSKDATDKELRQLVWHELGHTWFNLKHSDCPLMCPVLGDMGTVEQMKSVFKSVALKQ